MSSYLESAKSRVTFTFIPGRDGLLDGGHALGRAGDLDEDVGAADAAEELGRRGDRGGRVVGHPRRQLERDESVEMAGFVVDVPDLVGRVAHVRDRELEEGVGGVESRRLERRDGAVVVVRVGDRLLEDRGVRRDADDALVDHPPELARLKPAAPDVVEPRARARGDKLLQRVRHEVLLLDRRPHGSRPARELSRTLPPGPGHPVPGPPPVHPRCSGKPKRRRRAGADGMTVASACTSPAWVAMP